MRALTLNLPTKEVATCRIEQGKTPEGSQKQVGQLRDLKKTQRISMLRLVRDLASVTGSLDTSDSKMELYGARIKMS